MLSVKTIMLTDDLLDCVTDVGARKTCLFCSIKNNRLYGKPRSTQLHICVVYHVYQDLQLIPQFRLTL